MRYTNSSFRTREERDVIKGLTDAELRVKLLAVGESEEAVSEWLDDRNAIPTSLRRKMVSL